MYDIVTESMTPGIVSTFYNTIIGVSPGMGTIRATFSRPGVETYTNEYQVKVYPAPASVMLSETSIKLGVHETEHLSHTLSEGSIGKVTYASDNPKITAEESSEGMEVHANEPCVGNVTATTYNGKTATCHVEVVPGPTDITLERASAKMFMGQTLALSAEAVGGYTRAGVYFSSDNKNVCTVSDDGVITAKAAGEATITARTYNYHQKQCVVTVYDEPDTISFSGIRSRIGLGEQITFTPKDSSGNNLSLELSFSNPSVLSLQYGKYITGETLGSCTITASSATKSASFEITVCPAPEHITLSPGEVTMKETEQVALTPIFSEGAAGHIYYDSYQGGIARVSEAGVITAMKPGSAVISARTYNRRMAYCNVTVIPSEITYTLTPDDAEVGIGKTLQLRLTDPYGNVIPATYESSNRNTATVNDNGLVTGVWNGRAAITATVTDGRKYTAQIMVIAIPETITVSPSSMTLRVGQTGYYYLDSDVGPYYNFTSSSSNPGVVRITHASGASFDAVGVGTATVTVTSFNGKNTAIAVIVLPREDTLTPNLGDGMDLGVGETKNMNLRDIYGNPVTCTYVSSNVKVAKVDGKGNITGISTYPYPSSNARITAKAKDGRTALVDVVTYPAPGYLRLNVDSLRMPVGDTFQLVPSTQPESTTFSTVYSTSSVKVATVSKDGIVTAKGVGTCTITAKTYNGKFDKVTVTVGSVPTSVSVSQSKLTLGLNESRKLTVTLSKGSIGEHFYLSTDPTIVSIYDDVVTGLSKGSTILTVKTYNGMTATCEITVADAPTSLTLTTPLTIIGEKQIVQLEASVPAGSASAIRYTSGNTKVATVSGDGKVTGVKAGTVTITAATYNGVTAKVTLQVKKAPSSIKLNTRSAKLGVGDSIKLNATLSSGSTGTYAYKSSNNKVATVDQNGVVMTIAAGKATITVTTYNGRKATCAITVYRQPGFISVKSTYALRVSRYFTLAVKFPSGTYSNLAFASSNTAVATVDSAGKVRGVGRGTTTITVTTSNGKTATCVVTVK